MKTTEWSFAPFKGLKKALENNNRLLSKKIPLETKTDDDIFHDAMADVREIKEFRQIPLKKPPKFKLVPPQKDDSIEALRRIIKGEIKITLSDTGEYIEWIHPGMRKDIARKLHQGYFSVQDSIDLHGLNLIEAEEVFCSFFARALKKRLFCIKVIHGRGLRSPKGPVLKEALQKWLQGSLRKYILAYSTAKSCDGGLGATYIILKSK
jgi:DNA-nicking Smr family endonuclease